ncbi:hypothetical protein GDO78_017537, partial [Eleutherodactylus coqui]
LPTTGSAEDMLPLDPVTVLVSIVICILLAAILYKQKENIHPNYPPGPKPLPIIGNILNLNVQKPHLSFLELAKTFGPVFSIKIGVEKMVVLCGYDTVKEALVNHAEEFLDRPMPPAFMDATRGYGIGFTDLNNWKIMRQFAVSTLRNFGMGKTSLEEKINEESNCLVQMFKCYKGSK